MTGRESAALKSKRPKSAKSQFTFGVRRRVGVRGGWNEVERECGMGMSGGVKAMKIQH